MKAKACLLLALVLGLAALAAPAGAQAGFGISSLEANAKNKDGSIDNLAGSHPYEWTLSLAMNQDAEGTPEGTLRTLVVDLPAGMVGNPQALPRCPASDFEGQAPHCPGNSQIGVAQVKLKNVDDTATVPVFNLTPPFGVPASIGFSVANLNSFQEASLRPGDYGVRAFDQTIPDKEIVSVVETLWGVPMEAGHDPERFCPEGDTTIEGCKSEVDPEAFFTLPTSCTGPLRTVVRADSVQDPGAYAVKEALSLGEGGAPEGLTGCDRPPFNPSIEAQPETAVAESPTGLDFRLHVPQGSLPKAGDPEGTQAATAHLKDAVVSLPAGLTLNPSTAAGLAACSLAEIDLATNNPPSCPAASQVGTVTVDTPLLDHPLPGAVYIARQGENPFGSLIALYIVVDDPVSGVVVKLPGEVQTDPASGQLRTLVRQNPQVPFEDSPSTSSAARAARSPPRRPAAPTRPAPNWCPGAPPRARPPTARTPSGSPPRRWAGPARRARPPLPAASPSKPAPPSRWAAPTRPSS